MDLTFDFDNNINQ